MQACRMSDPGMRWEMDIYVRFASMCIHTIMQYMTNRASEVLAVKRCHFAAVEHTSCCQNCGIVDNVVVSFTFLKGMAKWEE